MTSAWVEQQCNTVRRRIIELGYATGKNGAHFGSSLSLVEILVAAYHYILNDLTQPVSGSDLAGRFFLSKGHGALGYFAVLESFGLLTSEQSSLFEVNGSNFFAHAHKDLNSGIEYSGGSLGLGVSLAVGVALASRLKGNLQDIIVLAGDGECDEGIVWEALMSAAHYKLSNFTLIVDRNMMQSDGDKRFIMGHQDICSKLLSFGFDVTQVNGHSCPELMTGLQKRADRPKAIVADTIKGCGISFMQANADWHHGSLNQSSYELALSELKG